MSRHSGRSNRLSHVADLNLERLQESMTDNSAPCDEIKAVGYFSRAWFRNPR